MEVLVVASSGFGVFSMGELVQVVFSLAMVNVLLCHNHESSWSLLKTKKDRSWPKIQGCLRRAGWRHGLQAVTLVLTSTFFLGDFHFVVLRCALFFFQHLLRNTLQWKQWKCLLCIVHLVKMFFLCHFVFSGMFYRSASLYHPQRRAIMHLKNQKRFFQYPPCLNINLHLSSIHVSCCTNIVT